MKKCLLMLFVFSLTVPVLADVNIVPLHVDAYNEPNCITIYYNADSETNLPRAFALDISVSGICNAAVPNIISVTGAHVGESNSAGKGYGIFMGSIDLSDTDNPVWNTPVAPGSDPCVAGTLPGSACTVELASLYSDSNYAPDSNGALLKVYVDSVVSSMTITENSRRGGVVMEDPNESVSVNISSMSNAWIHRYQGDIAGPPLPCHLGGTTGLPDNKVGPDDLTVLVSKWNLASPNDLTMADIAGSPLPPHLGGTEGKPDGKVGADDLTIMVSNWDKGGAVPW